MVHIGNNRSTVDNSGFRGELYQCLDPVNYMGTAEQYTFGLLVLDLLQLSIASRVYIGCDVVSWLPTPRPKAVFHSPTGARATTLTCARARCSVVRPTRSGTGPPSDRSKNAWSKRSAVRLSIRPRSLGPPRAGRRCLSISLGQPVC